MFLALWGLRSVIWLSSRNESADQPVPGVDIVLRPCQVPANLLKNLDQKKKDKFKVFFVSIDPERDSPEVIKDYLNSFENKIYGITGDPKKIFTMSKSWGVLSEKIFTEDGNYLINHSSSIILLKDGKYLSRINHHANYEDIFKNINKYLR